jgi:hypothetical protein
MASDAEKRRAAISALWKRGNLQWKLDTNQKEMYSHINKKANKVIVLSCSRRLGKTYFLCVTAIEYCIKNPNSTINFIAPTVKMLRTIISPTFKEILIDCPKELNPSFVRDDHTYTFKNGSKIRLAGTDNGHADSLRGTNANLCIIDEAAFCDQLNYVVNSVLMGSTLLTKGKIIMASTPPKSLSHPFMGFMLQAEKDNSLVKKTIYDNPRLKPEDIEEIALSIGGKESTDFKREYMVELIPDSNDVVIPEFTKALQKLVVVEVVKPQRYDAYVSMDIGVRDMTVLLFAYYDYKMGRLVIEDELVYSGKEVITDNIAADIVRKEDAYWGSYPVTVKRVADNNNLVMLNDLQMKHGLTFLPALKDNNEAAINNLRLLIKKGQIIRNPRCKTLIFQLENAVWNKTRTTYSRVGGHHFDAVDSLKMMCRSIDFTNNPYPAGFELNKGVDYFFNKPVEANSAFDNSLKSLFFRKKRKNTDKASF